MVADNGVSMTPTEAKMYELLKTGAFVTNAQLAGCLWDEMSNPSTVQYHLSNLRRQLRPHGLDVFSRNTDGVMGYIMARLISRRE